MLNIKWKSEAAVKCVSGGKGHQKVHVVTSNDRNPLSLEQQNESWGRAHMYRLLCIVFTAHFNAQHASVDIYCVKHYTLHMNSEISEHFVQYSGTFMELFMLMLASY